MTQARASTLGYGDWSHLESTWNVFVERRSGQFQRNECYQCDDVCCWCG
jgi:hypothetical protein